MQKDNGQVIAGARWRMAMSISGNFRHAFVCFVRQGFVTRGTFMQDKVGQHTSSENVAVVLKFQQAVQVHPPD